MCVLLVLRTCIRLPYTTDKRNNLWCKPNQGCHPGHVQLPRTHTYTHLAPHSVKREDRGGSQRRLKSNRLEIIKYVIVQHDLRKSTTEATLSTTRWCRCWWKDSSSRPFLAPLAQSRQGARYCPRVARLPKHFWFVCVCVCFFNITSVMPCSHCQHIYTGI